MRQTVLGVYDSYADACSAQRALGEAGVAPADIAVYSTSVAASIEKGPRVYAPGSASVHPRAPVFDQLDRLFAQLFNQGEYPPETEDYKEFIRRGGAIVSADVPEMQVDLAREVMRRAGAADIDERSRAWGRGPAQAAWSADAQRHAGLTGHAPSAGHESTSGLHGDDTASAAARTEARHTAFSSTTGGMQQVSTRTEEPGANPPLERERRTPGTLGVPHTTAGTERTPDDPAGHAVSRAASPHDSGASAMKPPQQTSSKGLGDPLMGTPLDDGTYRDRFPKDYDASYAKAGASSDGRRYRRTQARSGVTPVQPMPDERHRLHESGWERFKVAVRHGWERVTRH